MTRVTMSDVAREAGVSLMTVSRVVNNKDEISPDTRKRVLEVIERLGYRPSGIARGLVTQRTSTLGLVVPDVSNPFFAEVARGVEQVAYAEGYNVFLCNTEENKKRELAVLESLEEMRVDGLVLCSSRLDERELRNIVARHATAVLVNRRLEGEGVRSVLVDDEMGGRLTTEHLIASGHRAVGFLTGPVASHSGQQRVGGYRQAMAAAGLEVKPGWLHPCPPVVRGGKETATELLAGHPELTALVCYNDLVAVGALQACATLGRQVPGDVAVVGHDDIPLAALVSPPLTTCRVSRYDLGMRAVRLLLNEISGVGDEGDGLMLRPELVVRASAPTGKPGEER